MSSPDLHWFPFFAKDWLSSRARMAMSPAQRGAYIDLLALAWGEGDSEPCLDPSPEILRGLSGLGDEWDKLSPLILAQFEERDGLLYNEKLSEVWHLAQEKHAKAVKRGKKGGRPRKAKGKLELTQKEVGGKQLHLQEAVSLTEKQASVVAAAEIVEPTGTLGVETPRPVEMPMERGVRGSKTPFREMVAQVVAALKPAEAT